MFLVVVSIMYHSSMLLPPATYGLVRLDRKARRFELSTRFFTKKKRVGV